MRSLSTTILLIVFTLILISCKAAPNEQTPGSVAPDPQPVSTDVPTPGVQDDPADELSWIFDEPATPVDVDVVLETESSVQALIPLEGGSITATGTDGTQYTLEIPADALLVETMIGLTPVSSLSEMPFGSEQTYAVQLSPDGLILQNYAVLTITPVTEIPLAEQVVFGYQADGSDLILAAPVLGSEEIKINILHFSGNGVTKGFWADIEPERRRLGGDIERRLLNRVNEALINLRQEGSEDGELVSSLFREAFLQYVDQVVRPRVEAAGDSCANGRLALETVNSFKHQAAVLGFNPDEFLAGIDSTALLEKAMRVCVIEEFEICVEDHIIYRMIPALGQVERQYALFGIEDGPALREARDLTIKCMTFRLMFESTGKNILEEGGFHSSVTSKLILRYDLKQGFILGAVAELINTDFEFYSVYCGVTSIPGGGDFAVLGLSYDMETDAEGQYSELGVTDFNLVYMPGNTSETFTAECPGGGTLPTLSIPLWTTTFMETHRPEYEGGGFEARDWEMLGGDLFARKKWKITSQIPGVSESGSFELYHAPGE